MAWERALIEKHKDSRNLMDSSRSQDSKINKRRLKTINAFNDTVFSKGPIQLSGVDSTENLKKKRIAS